MPQGHGKAFAVMRFKTRLRSLLVSAVDCIPGAKAFLRDVVRDRWLLRLAVMARVWRERYLQRRLVAVGGTRIPKVVLRTLPLSDESARTVEIYADLYQRFRDSGQR